MKRLCLFAALACIPAAFGQEIDLTDDKAPAPVPAPAAPPAGDLVNIEVIFTKYEAAAAPGASAADVLDDKALAAMRPNLKQVSAPRVTAFDTQLVTVSMTTRHAYVRSRDKAGKAVNDEVQSGVVLKAKPTIQGKAVQFAFTLTRSELADPVAKLQTPRGDVELPVITTDEIKATLELASGRELALRVRSRGRKEVMILLIRATIIRRAAVKKPN